MTLAFHIGVGVLKIRFVVAWAPPIAAVR